MKMRLAVPVLAGAVFAAAAAGCGGPRDNVAYVDPKSMTLSETFSDTDIRMLSEYFTESMIGAAVIKNATKTPVVLPWSLRNKTLRHDINPAVIMDQITTAVLRTGRIRLVEEDVREKLMKEYEYHAGGLVDPKTRKSPGKQVGADLVLVGDIEEKRMRERGDKILYYYVSLKLTDLERGETVWKDNKEIKKRVR